MAKVVSLFKIRGTIGDLTFRETKSGTVAGLKPGPTREQVLTSDRFDQTRRNAGEFKGAIKDATLLRRALGDAINGVRHSLLNSQMNKLLHRVAKQDGQNDYGSRHAAAGNISLLAGFDFNHELSLDKALPVKLQHNMDAATGVLQLELPSFIARRKKEFPKEATHFRIVSCGAIVDFAHDCYSNTIKTSDLLPLGKKTPDVICLEHRLKAGPGEVLLQVAGIQFYKVVNGKEELLKGGAMKVLAAARIANELHESAKAGLPDTQVGDKREKPYTAKQLHALTNPFTKRMPQQSNSTLPDTHCTACCYDSLMPLLPDIENCTN
jgi:hypothetical protein